MKEIINELMEEINDQELEGQVVGGMIVKDNPIPSETAGRIARCYSRM